MSRQFPARAPAARFPAMIGPSLWVILQVLVPLVLGAALLGCQDAAVSDPTTGAARPAVQLTAEVDRAEAIAGEAITYTVTLDRDPAVKAGMPEIFSRIEGFRIADMKTEGPITRDGRVVEKRVFELRAHEPGSYILPEVKVTWTDAKGQSQTAGAPQVFVEVKTSIKEGEEEADIKDIKPLEQPPVDYRRIALLAGGAAALLALAAGLFWFVRRRRNRIEPPAPPRPPWEVAREALAELERSGLLEAGDARTWCYQLSEIFRRYLEQRFGFPALEETTEEILAAFRRSSIPVGRPQDLARRILTGTDRTKYAKQVPTPTEAAELLQAARAFIDATEPPPQVQDAPTGEVTSASRRAP